MYLYKLKPIIFFYVFSQRNLSKESYKLRSLVAEANPNIAFFGTFKSSVPMIIFWR
jgi:hypothetical protein